MGIYKYLVTFSWAVMQYLPYGGLKWVDDLSNQDFYMVPDDNHIGYILEIHAEIPLELHEKFRELPLCAERMAAPNSKHKNYSQRFTIKNVT